MIKEAQYPDQSICVIGISGKKETGKKIFAELLQNELERICDKPIMKVGYADQIKHTLVSMFSPKLTWAHFDKKDDPIVGLKVDGELATARKLLQNFGEYTKQIDPLVWVDRVFKYRIYDYFYIIHDVRLKDEAQAIIDNNGMFIRLESETKSNDKDRTETELDNFEFPIVVSVNEDRELMKEDVREIIKNINV